MARILVTVLTLLAFTACTTLQPLPDAQPATIQQAVKKGDRVEVEKTDGTRLTLTIEEVGADYIQGTEGSTRHRVLYSSIRRLGTRSMTTSDKAWTAVIAGVVVAGVIAAASSGGGGGGGSGY